MEKRVGRGRKRKTANTDMRKDIICNQDKMEFGVGSNHMHSFFLMSFYCKEGESEVQASGSRKRIELPASGSTEPKECCPQPRQAGD